jgi:hypothetical protein
MYITKEIFSVFKKDGSLSTRQKIIFVFECDSCHMTYKKPRHKVSKSKSGLTFCSVSCRHAANKKGNKLCESREKHCIEKYGTSSPTKLLETQEKGRATLRRKYGDDVSSPLAVPGAKEKRRRTHLERYGAEETFQNEQFVKKRAATWLKRYGVPYHPFPKDANIKSRLAMAKMPHKWSSKVELEYGVLLRERFGADDVFAQKWINRWPIDFYIKSIDTYIQFDGVYWHALNCSLDVLKESKSPRDKARLKKWEADRTQDEWFSSHDLRLVRITDEEFKYSPSHCIDIL